MLSQKQVALDLIGKHVAEYLELDTQQIYKERVLLAQQLLIQQKVQRQPDGTFLIQGSRQKPYKVNSICECVDYTRHAQYGETQGSPNGWCKHRIAAKLYMKVLLDLDEQRKAGIPHFHFTCDHKSEMELCWQQSCPEPMDQLCASCLEAMRQIADIEEHTNDAQHGPTSPAVLAKLAEPPYEKASPQKSKTRTAQRTQSPLPEAPASLNLKLKLPGGGELMYTMRSMRTGEAGDVELEARLPGVLDFLEGLGSETVTPQGSWWRRLLESLRLPSNGQGSF